MAVSLNKTIWRETHEQVDNKVLLAGLTENQELVLRLKGSKDGDKRIKLIDLYNDFLVAKNAPTGSADALTVAKVIEDIQEWAMVADIAPTEKTKMFAFFQQLKAEYGRNK